MPERNLNFDEFVDRRGTDCLKFDFATRRGRPEGLRSYWVADMDFRVSSYIQDAIREVVEHGVFGYTESTERYFEAVSGWMKTRHDFEVGEETLVKTPGVVYALAQAVRAFTEPGDAVLIQQPVYYPFSEVIKENGRRLVSSDLVICQDGLYRIDFGDFERKIVENSVKLFLLCSPHNPVARVWTTGELELIGEICQRHGVVVVSDEIHQDFVFSGKHHVFQNVRPEFADFTVTCTAPSKTFNIAGLQTSNIFISNRSLRAKFRRAIAESGYSQLNTLGLAATRAAYAQGGEWYEAMMKYVEGNLDFAVEFVNNEIPGASTVKNEGTYLLWIDMRQTGWTNGQIEDLVVNDAKLWLDGGGIFGNPGKCFQRVNIACQRDYLRQGLESLRDAVKNRMAKEGREE